MTRFVLDRRRRDLVSLSQAVAVRLRVIETAMVQQASDGYGSHGAGSGAGHTPVEGAVMQRWKVDNDWTALVAALDRAIHELELVLNVGDAYLVTGVQDSHRCSGKDGRCSRIAVSQGLCHACYVAERRAR